MKKALITGADGFIGSQNGYQVRALSFYNSFNYWGWPEDISANSDLMD